MIAEKCFGPDWISAKASELRYPDKNVIERVVRAFSLLDMLARSGCPFVFKGGTSLMLLLQDTGTRLSTDIDIALRGAINAWQFDFLQRGIKKMRNFMYDGRQYRIDEAITDAARVAYMVTLIEKGVDAIERYPNDPLAVKDLSIDSQTMNRLNKLKKTFPEAFWYWYLTAQLLQN